MHLVIVNQYGLPAGMPGITRHGDLAAELVRRGHQVTLVASRFNYLTRQEAPGASRWRDAHGVAFRFLNTGTYRANDRRRVRSMVSFTIRAAFDGIRLRPRPDAVMASSPHLLAGVAGWIVARWCRVPFLFEIRDLWPQALVDLGGLRAGSRTHRALELVERWLYQRADRIVIVPPHADRRVAEAGASRSKCVHIPNATALPEVEPEAIPSSLADLFERGGSRDVLLYGGAQGVSNGLTVVLDALDVLRASDPAAYDAIAVIFIGDGTEHSRLVAEAARRSHDLVLFHPPISKGAMRTALERASALLVSFADAPVYEYGLSPNKLFDALFAARPVLLASRLTDSPVDLAQAGFRFEPGSGGSLAARIREVFALPVTDRLAMGRRGRALAEREYTIASTGARLEALLREVVGVPG